MKKIKKSKSGITLISLVVTIIVLLILAGVTLTMLTGENGIIKRSINAKELYLQAQENEENTLDDMDKIGDKYLKGEMKLNKSNLELKIVDGVAGKEGIAQLNAILWDIKGNISWNSSDTSETYVSITPTQDGKSVTVTAKAATTTPLTITATCGDYSESCSVTVTSIYTQHTKKIGTTRSIDVSSVLPNDYRDLTADDFIVELSGEVNYSQETTSIQTGTDVTYNPITKTYNAETGNLTISGGQIIYHRYQASNNDSYSTKTFDPGVVVYAVTGRKAETSNNRNIDVSKIFPDCYKNLTKDNFIVEITNENYYCNHNSKQYMSGARTIFTPVTITYNSQTGNLSVSGGTLFYRLYRATHEDWSALYEETKNLDIKVNMFYNEIEK